VTEYVGTQWDPTGFYVISEMSAMLKLLD